MVWMLLARLIIKGSCNYQFTLCGSLWHWIFSPVMCKKQTIQRHCLRRCLTLRKRQKKTRQHWQEYPSVVAASWENQTLIIVYMYFMILIIMMYLRTYHHYISKTFFHNMMRIKTVLQFSNFEYLMQTKAVRELYVKSDGSWRPDVYFCADLRFSQASLSAKKLHLLFCR